MAVPRFSLASDGWYWPAYLLLVFEPETDRNPLVSFQQEQEQKLDMILLVFMELVE